MNKISGLLALCVLAILAAPAFGQGNAQMMADKYKQGVTELKGGNAAAAATLLQEAVAAAGPAAQPSQILADARYALGFALVQQRKLLQAVPVLEALVSQNPAHTNGRFLLGVTLTRAFSGDSSQRGLEVLQQLAKESEGGLQAAVTQTAARVGYNVSTAEAASGNTGRALAMVTGLTNELNSAPSADEAENIHLRFAVGSYLAASGDNDGAVFELEFLMGGTKGKNKGYALKNGVTAKQVLSNAYYQGAVKDLDGGANGADSALGKIKELSKLEGQTALDAHHVNAFAYDLKGDKESLAKEMEAIKGMDAAYHAKMQGS